MASLVRKPSQDWCLVSIVWSKVAQAWRTHCFLKYGTDFLAMRIDWSKLPPLFVIKGKIPEAAWSGPLVDFVVNREVAGLGTATPCVSLIDVDYSIQNIRLLWETLVILSRDALVFDISAFHVQRTLTYWFDCQCHPLVMKHYTQIKANTPFD